MSGSKSKWIRYRKLLDKVSNWPSYLLKKMIGFGESFEFDIKDFEKIKVDTQMLGPFRENFLDEIYFRNIPKQVFENQTKPVIVDIGANVGFFSLASFSKYPKASIYSFEPHPYCYKVMQSYQKKYDKYHWKTFQKAMDGEKKQLTLKASTLDGFTTMASVFDSEATEHEFTVEAIDLGSLILEENLEQIDFMKVDCEGSEYAILYGLTESDLVKVKAMCIETHKGKEDKQNIESLHSFLEMNGFTTQCESENYTGYIWAWRKS